MLVGAMVPDRSIGGLGNATLDKKHLKALFLTWAIMGLWHGASWTFLLWGLYHGVVIFIYRLIEPHTHHLNHVVRSLGSFLITLPLMMLAWIPFRADSLLATFEMWGRVLEPSAYLWLGMRENVYLITALILVGFILIYFLRNKIVPLLLERKLIIFIGNTVMIAVIIVFLRPINQFIYFQF
jgi:hypothetical protein